MYGIYLYTHIYTHIYTHTNHYYHEAINSLVTHGVRTIYMHAYNILAAVYVHMSITITLLAQTNS